MLIKTYGRTAEQPTVTRNEIVAVMQELTTIGRARRNDPEYLATYAAAREFTVRCARGDIDIRIERRAGQLSVAGRFRRARLGL